MVTNSQVGITAADNVWSTIFAGTADMCQLVTTCDIFAWAMESGLEKRILEQRGVVLEAPGNGIMSVYESVANLVAEYALAYDERDWDALIECFTPDASLTLRVAGGDRVGPFRGHAEIMRLMRGSAAAQDDRRRHVCTNLMVSPTGSGMAAARSYLTLLSVRDRRLTVLSTGTYTDEVALTEGTWRLRTRHLELDLPADDRLPG
ncbi:ring hydroxylating beta subunit family [Stigmatella aurantiaca DW4/3-1]|uniref:Ring hydroxylating beta subunit family n=1 Tax=Stigmatella aurantiaca (strain DW4/3-1) TaxID=378806 RepID=Q08R09_STIAD|nr:ring hydroxylating beta subunit family [Stigmatella aurantiaca DW4/3-1]EAU67111.1 ring hydroxylating beta subunit family [Stigmatella aurantiaca DW4/3-1]